MYYFPALVVEKEKFVSRQKSLCEFSRLLYAIRRIQCTERVPFSSLMWVSECPLKKGYVVFHLKRRRAILERAA